MNSSQPQSDPITIVISEIVAPDRIAEYEAWAKGINQASKQAAGFLGVEVIRPRDQTHPEYVVIVKFDNYVNCRNWLASPTYQQWIAKSEQFVSARSQQHLPSGVELWFSLPKNTIKPLAQPPYYKKVILGVLAVYPLILLANAVLNPLLKGLPALLGLLISVTFVSALLTYPVMPWLTQILGFWLYPAASRRR